MRRAALVLAVLAGCSEAHKVVVSNQDTVELQLDILASDGRFKWAVVLAPGERRATTFHPTQDVGFRVTVKVAGRRLYESTELGYASAGTSSPPTCIEVTRRTATEKPCR